MLATNGSTLDLRHALGSALPEATASALSAALANPAELHPNGPELQRLIVSWRQSLSGSTARPESLAVVDYLQRLPNYPISYNAAHSCDPAGRLSVWSAPDYSGPVLLSANKLDKLRQSRQTVVPLQSIPRALRPAFSARPGAALADVDLASAHVSIAARLAGDTVLARDIADGSFRGRLSIDFGVDMDASKQIASALLCGATPRGLVHAVGIDLATAEQGHAGFFARYSALRQLLDAVAARCRTGLPLDVIRPDGLRVRVSSGELDGRHVRYRESSSAPAAAARWLSSLLWRACETSVLHAVLVRVHQELHGKVRLVLPMYDGALFACAAGAEGLAGDVVVGMFADEARRAGLPELRAVAKCGSTWPC